MERNRSIMSRHVTVVTCSDAIHWNDRQQWVDRCVVALVTVSNWNARTHSKFVPSFHQFLTKVREVRKKREQEQKCLVPPTETHSIIIFWCGLLFRLNSVAMVETNIERKLSIFVLSSSSATPSLLLLFVGFCCGHGSYCHRFSISFHLLRLLLLLCMGLVHETRSWTGQNPVKFILFSCIGRPV